MEARFLKMKADELTKTYHLKRPAGISIYAPPSALVSSTKYTEWSLNEHMTKNPYGLGEQNRQHALAGINFSCPTRRSVYDALCIIYPIEPFNNEIISDLIIIDRIHDHKDVFDKSGVGKALTVYTAYGLLIRVTLRIPRETSIYYFEDAIINKGGPEWWLEDNGILGESNPLGRCTLKLTKLVGR